jgi:class 3 adenylate cyclase
MRVGSLVPGLRRLASALMESVHAGQLSAEERDAFHAELAEAACKRMNGFAWLLLLVHAGLLLRDVTLDTSSFSPNEALWAHWLFLLHVAMLLGSSLTVLLLSKLDGPQARARVACWFMGFLLAWSGLVSGADQLIGAGITLFLMLNLASAVFVTFSGAATARAFMLGMASFIFGQLWFTRTSALAFSQLVNGTACAGAALLFSRMLYASRARDFVQRTTIARQHAELEEAHAWLAAERARSERVLYAVLPSRIADRLRHGESPIADTYSELTVLFADLTGFTHLAAELPAREMLDILNELFSHFDEISAKNGLEKIKTVGDAYIAVRGFSEPSLTDVQAAADAALALQAAVLAVARRRNRALSLRVGIARGSATAGVLGTERLLYDVWGDAVNMASRLETAAAPGESVIPESLAEALATSHELGPTRIRELKGKGHVGTRVILKPRAALEPLSKVL